MNLIFLKNKQLKPKILWGPTFLTLLNIVLSSVVISYPSFIIRIYIIYMTLRNTNQEGFSLCMYICIISKVSWKNTYPYRVWFTLIVPLLFILHTLYYIQLIIIKSQLSPPNKVSGIHYNLCSHTVPSNSNLHAFLTWPRWHLMAAVVWASPLDFSVKQQKSIVPRHI